MRFQIIFLMLVFPSIVFSSPCSEIDLRVDLSDDEKAWLDRNHIVRVRTGNSPPFMLSNGEIQGIAIDYLTHIFDNCGIRFKYIGPTEVTWPEALDNIKRHVVVDMVPTAKITDKRKKDMIFTDEYIFAPWVIFTRSDADFVSSLDDLKGKTVSVEEGFVMHQVLAQNYPEIHLKVASANLDNFTQIPIKDLSTGLVDAYIGNLLTTTYMIQTIGYTNVKVAAPAPFGNHNQAMAIRSDWPELASIINKALASMTSEEHAAIRNKWLSIRYEYGIDKAYVFKWVLSVTGIAMLIIGFVLFSNRRLKSEVVLRKETENELKRQRDLFELVINSVPARIFWKDLSLEYLGCNIHFAKDSGMDRPEDVTGKDDYDLVWKEDAEVYRADDMHVIRTGIPKLMYEEPFLNKEGKRIWWLTNKMPLKNHDGDIIGVIATSENITEQKKARREKRILEAQLHQSQKLESIGNLAGGIAHDFNNILSSIIGYTELALLEASKGTSLEDSLQEVYTAGKRAKELVKQILAFARQSDEKRSPVQPSKVAKEVLQFIRSTIPTTIEIQQEIYSDGLIMANTTQVHQVLMNLCTNAAHAMEEKGGILKVRLKNVEIDKADLSSDIRPGEYIEITVSDTGAGIAPEIIGSIFEPYFTTKGFGEGTGMGLAVTHGIIKSYGGKITVDSKLGKGTKFTIHLPLNRKRRIPGKYTLGQLPSGNERILFIDDEESIAKMGSQILERLGYSVTTKTSSIDALKLFREKSEAFDIVVTDMTMPHMTGDKLAIELMKIRSDILVILYTGYSNKISDETALEIGIKAFAYKPMVTADLAKTVRRVLDDAKAETQQ